MSPDRRSPVLDPGTRLSEILFGLIMVMTFTGSLHAASAGREQVRTMLFAALGCNLAWGIVDGVMFLLNDLVLRNRAAADLRLLQAAKTDAEADAILAGRFEEEIARALRPGDLAALLARLRSLPPPPQRARVTKRSLAGAGAVLLLVFGASFPAAVPFLLIDDPVTALRVSHGVSIAALFATGVAMAGSTGLPRARTGLAVAGLGLVLALLTMALGG